MIRLVFAFCLCLGVAGAQAQFWPPSVIPHTVGGGGGGVMTHYISQWKPSTAYESGGTYADVIYVAGSNNTYIQTAASCMSTTGAGPTGTGSGITDGTCTWNFMHSGSNYVVPANYTSTISAEAIGGGGGGGNGGDPYAGNIVAGEGGAYAKVTTLSTSASAVVQFQAGTGGAGGIADPNNAEGASGTESWFKGASCAAATVCADFGAGSAVNGSQAGANSVGSLKQKGGQGGRGSASGGAGGGGAGGPDGDGAAGGDDPSDNMGGGGGGADGGSAGQPSTPNGGDGGNNFAGVGHGLGGLNNGTAATSGTAGGGGGGAYPDGAAFVAGQGSCGIIYDSLHGPGGGGGGSAGWTSSPSPPGNGFCGSGGGAGGMNNDGGSAHLDGGHGGDGFIVFKFNHS